MKTTIIYSVNGREIGRDTYNKGLSCAEAATAIREMANIVPNLKISIESAYGSNI